MKKIFILFAALIFFSFGTVLVYGETVTNERYGFWIDKPAGWSRATEGLDNDLAERFMEPNGLGFIEIYVGTNISGGSIDVLASGWEAKLLGNLDYMKKKNSSSSITIGGFPAILGVYEGDTQGIPLKTNVAYVVGASKAFAMVGVLRKDTGSNLESEIQRIFSSLKLDRPTVAVANLSSVAVPSLPSGQVAVASSQPQAAAPQSAPEVSYDLKIPSGWENDKNIPDPDVTLQVLRNKKNKASIVSVMRGKLDCFTSEELKALVEMSMESFGQKNPLFEKKISEIELNLEGGIGIAVVFLGKNAENKAVKSLAHYVSFKNACFIVTGTIPMDASEEEWNEIDGIINSFKIVPKK